MYRALHIVAIQCAYDTPTPIDTDAGFIPPVRLTRVPKTI